MITDTQLLAKKTHKITYVVYICDKSETSPRMWLNSDAPTKREALNFGIEYAMRILKLRRNEFYIVMDKVEGNK